MIYTLPKLPYEYNSLEPFMDAETVEIHYAKHHQTYTDKLNAALKDSEIEEQPIEEILADPDSIPRELQEPVINFGGGYLNHNLFWEILKPNPNGESNLPVGEIADEINVKFGSFEKFKELFSAAALNVFGSGWAWLVYSKDGIKIKESPNQDSPIMDGNKPILTIDVWEHAYYLKYRNKRADYIANFWNLVNWERVNELYLEVESN